MRRELKGVVRKHFGVGGRDPEKPRPSKSVRVHDGKWFMLTDQNNELSDEKYV